MTPPSPAGCVNQLTPPVCIHVLSRKPKAGEQNYAIHVVTCLTGDTTAAKQHNATIRPQPKAPRYERCAEGPRDATKRDSLTGYP